MGIIDTAQARIECRRARHEQHKAPITASDKVLEAVLRKHILPPLFEKTDDLIDEHFGVNTGSILTLSRLGRGLSGVALRGAAIIPGSVEVNRGGIYRMANIIRTPSDSWLAVNELVVPEDVIEHFTDAGHTYVDTNRLTGVNFILTPPEKT